MFTKLYKWYGKKTVRVILAVIVVLGLGGLVLSALNGAEPQTQERTATQVVRTASVAELAANGSSVSVIGTVKAISQAEVRSETGGRITSVRAAIGDRVAAGSVLATFENSREQASVLQAEGSYEAALAAAAQSDVGVENAQTSLVAAKQNALSAHRDIYISVTRAIYNTVDQLLSNPRGPNPGVRFDSRGQALRISDERVAIGAILDEWENELDVFTPEDAHDNLTELYTRTEKVHSFITQISDLFSRVDSDNRYSETQMSTIKSSLTSSRSDLSGALSRIRSIQTDIQQAEERLAQAEIGGTGTEVSAADAQVKQALGSLRAAQSTLEKTIIRAPIAGVVNSVSVEVGEYVGTASPVAEVMNTGALEITAFLSEQDRARVAVGDVLEIEGGYEGTITRIAPSINRTTQKYEVKISPDTAELESGDVVRIALAKGGNETTEENLTYYLPLTAVKLTSDNAVVFTVQDGILIEHEIVLGDIRGNSIAVANGISPEMELVVDARGLTAGTEVRIVD